MWLPSCCAAGGEFFWNRKKVVYCTKLLAIGSIHPVRSIREEQEVVNAIDIAIVVIALLSGALGIYWGVIRQVLAVAGVVAASTVAGRYGVEIGDMIALALPDVALAQMLGFVVVFLGVASLVSLLATLLHHFVGTLTIRLLDRVGGALLGMFQALLACAVLVIAAATYPHELWYAAITSSRLAAPLVRAFSSVLILLPEAFRFAARMTFQVS